MQELFSPGEWLASDCPGSTTSAPPFLQAASLGGKEHKPPTDSAVSPSALCSQPILSGPQAHLGIDSKLPDTIHTPPSSVTQT